MAIEKPLVPPAVRKALEVSLKDFVEVNDPIFNLLMHPVTGEFEGQQVFILGLKGLSEGLGLDHAEPGGWRLMAWDGLELAAAADVDAPLSAGVSQQAPEAPELDCVWHGESIRAAFEAIARAALALPAAVVNSAFDLVQLWIPGLLIEALWFRAKDQPPGSSWILPYRHQIPQLDPSTAYTEEKFLGIVRPLATERLKFNDALPPDQRRHDSGQ